MLEIKGVNSPTELGDLIGRTLIEKVDELGEEVFRAKKGTSHALLDLYIGMLEAGSSPVGYSPKVADAMKRLKELVSPELVANLKT